MVATYRLRLNVMLTLAALLAATLVATPASGSASGTLTVSYFDVGQADATLLQHDDATILIDTGSWQRSDVVTYLEAAGVSELDLVVVTHPHADHIGQFDQVMNTFDVEEVWWSGSVTTSQTFERALTAFEASDATYEEPRVGDTATIGQFDIEIVNPSAGVNLNNLHDANLAMRITFGEVRLLFTGDAEASTEARMVSQSASMLDADIYQVGHHGSLTSTTATFLDVVDPTVAIYSASATNQYGHPAPEVITRMESAGVEVFGTDVNGTTTVTTDGQHVTVAPEVGQQFTFSTSGAPGGGSSDSPFSDVAGTTHERSIAAIVDAGITGGYPDGTYRPNAPVTRGQMATFLTRGLDLPAWQAPPVDPTITCVDINRADVEMLQEIIHIGPERAAEIVRLRPFASVDDLDRVTGIGPARLADIKAQGLAATSCSATGGGSQEPFNDIAGTTHYNGILSIVQAEITGGYPDGTYRPSVDVNRGQMATFLTRGLDLPPSNQTFSDTSGTTHERSIGAVAAAEITGGYPDGTYRPNAPVTRGQMATFLARALDLL